MTSVLNSPRFQSNTPDGFRLRAELIHQISVSTDAPDTTVFGYASKLKRFLSFQTLSIRDGRHEPLPRPSLCNNISLLRVGRPSGAYRSCGPLTLGLNSCGVACR